MNLAEFEIPLVSFIFLVLLDFIYFSKNRLKLIENKYYDAMLIFSTIMSFLDTAIHIMCSFYSFETLSTVFYPLINISNKLFSLLFSIVFTLFLGYILLITYSKIKENKEKLLKVIVFFNVFILLILQFTKIELTTTQNVTNVQGLTLYIGYFVVALSLIISLIIALKRIKNLDKRYYSIFSIIVVVMVLYPITIIFKGFIIYDLVLALLCYIMYFTIENPDIKMIEEVSDAKDKAEKYNNDKSIFIFNITQQLRYPLNIIEQRSEQINSFKNDEINELVSDIKFSVQKINNLLNGTMNIDVIDVNKVKVVDTKYKLNNIIDKIVLTNEPKIKNKNLEFIVDVDKKLPEELYGDSIRIKQIIDAIMSNSIKYTEKGYIEFNIRSVIKEEICRLIIAIKDSGKGITSEEIDSIMNEDNKDFVETADKDDLTLSTVKKLVNMIGGTMTIDSEINKGTEVIVYIDQKIANIDENLNNIVKEYKTKTVKKKILVVEDSEVIINNLKKKLNKTYKVDYVTTGEQALNIIREQNNYDLIIIKEDLPKLNGLKIYEKLKQIKDFNISVILNTEINSKNYNNKKLNFSNYSTNSNIIDKIKETLDNK